MNFSSISGAINSDATGSYNELAELYDALIPDPEGFTDFYLNLCSSGRLRILYIGCGTGRLLEEIASLGHTCLGVDPSSKSIEIAAKRLEDSHLVFEVLVDALPELLEVKGTFDVVLAAGGVFEYLLTTKEQMMALGRIWNILKPGGVLAFDIAAPPFATDNVEGNYQGHLDSSLPNNIDLESSEVRFGFDHFYQLVRSTCTFNFENREPLVVEYVTRYTTISELQLLLKCSGYKSKIYGGFDYSPVNRSSSNFVVVARKEEL